MTQLIIDIGNTSIKTILVIENQFTAIKRFDNNNRLLDYIEENELTSTSCIISSVRSETITKDIVRKLSSPIILNSKTPIPIINSYGSPKTLGYDRIANAIAASSMHPGENNLIIDVGTCLKFDFVNSNNEYLGGSISLGFLMRYNALHNFTDNLPLLKNEVTNQLLGIDTKSSMVSGVYLGMSGEIKQFVRNYESIYSKLNIFLTGGDLSYFENEELSQKNSIFADPMLTLKGLKEILDYNEKNK